MSPIPLYRVVSGPGALTIGTIVRTIMFQPVADLERHDGLEVQQQERAVLQPAARS